MTPYDREARCYVNVPEPKRFQPKEHRGEDGTREDKRDACGYRESWALLDGLKMIYSEDEC